jgi:hypothetical protein
MAAAHYGLIIVAALFVFTRLMPQPVGSVIYWGLLTVQLSWGAMTCWRRTGLPFATAALVSSAVMSVCLVVLAALSHPFPDLLPESWVPLGGGMAIGPIFLVIESRVNRAKWKLWAQHMEHKSVWDIVTGRHIPQVRNGGA